MFSNLSQKAEWLCMMLKKHSYLHFDISIFLHFLFFLNGPNNTYNTHAVDNPKPTPHTKPHPPATAVEINDGSSLFIPAINHKS